MNPENPDWERLLHGFLDDEISEEDREMVLKAVQSNPDQAEEISLHRRIDDVARRLYAPPQGLDIVPAEGKDVSPATTNANAADISPASRSKFTDTWRIALVALAASIAWIAVGMNWFSSSRSDEIAFHSQPLTRVYKQCLNEGFQPYWICDDDAVMAATFQRRQDVPLQLAELPSGRQMVGLSYLAGISRRSTSMLARVDDQPVVVFIDRADRDWKPETGYFEDEGLHVIRMERYGLVFYEVTPFDSIRVAEFFHPQRSPKTQDEHFDEE